MISTINKRFIYVLLVKVLSVSALFAVQIAFARIMNVETYGVYSYILSIVTVFSFFVIFGLDKVSIKEVSLLYEDGENRKINRQSISYYNIIILNVAISAPILYLFMNALHRETDSVWFFISSFLLLTLVTISKMSSSVSKGLGLVIFSEVSLNSLRPVFLLCTLLFIISLGWELSLISVTTASYLLSMFITGFVNYSKVGGALFRFSLQSIDLYRKLFPFFIISIGGVLVSNIGILVLGVVASRSDVALYAASSKIVNLVLTGLVSANLLIAPKLSVLYAQKKTGEMLALIRKNNIFVALITLVPVLIILFKGELVLSFFGRDYVSAIVVLKVLLVGQIINVFCGPVNLICVMAGQERRSAILLLVVCLVELCLCAVFTLQCGVIGAAVAHVVSLFLINVLQAHIVYKHIGINPTFFNVFKFS